MITVLAVHFAVAAVAPFIFRRFGRNSFYGLAAVPAGSFVWLLLQHAAVRHAVSLGSPRYLPEGLPPPSGRRENARVFRSIKHVSRTAAGALSWRWSHDDETNRERT